jgi:transposase
VGDAAQIRAMSIRRQKHDPRDARHLMDLLASGRFPRIWTPSPRERDLRQLLRHRDKLVRMRTAVKNRLHALALSQGLCRRHKTVERPRSVRVARLRLCLGQAGDGRTCASLQAYSCRLATICFISWNLAAQLIPAPEVN